MWDGFPKKVANKVIKQPALLTLHLIQTLKQASGFDCHAMEIKFFNLETPGSQKLNIIVEKISKLNSYYFKIQKNLKSSVIAKAKHPILIILLLCINFPTYIKLKLFQGSFL